MEISIVKKQNELPAEILLIVFKYLSAYDLCRCSAVSRTFRSSANSNILWKQLCKERWKKLMNQPLELHPGVNYNHIENTLSIKEIKRILKRRDLYYQGFVEKSEFINLLLKTTPRKVPLIGSKWKASYIVAEIDSKRTQITKAELVSKRFSFRFKAWPENENRGFTAQFNADYTYQSNLFDQVLHWRFYAGSIQVEQYPPSDFFRTEDWGWGIQNSHVIYYELPNVE